MINTEQFLEKLLEYFPYLETEYKENIDKYDEILETVIIEDIFMPEIIKTINEDNEISKLINMFDYFEKVVNFGEKDLIDTVTVTVLEILGNDKKTLAIARKYMGKKTIELQILADKDLGRIID